LIVFLGPNATRFPGELIRLMMPAQVLILLAVIGTRSGERPRAAVRRH
jgi:hypothetical protein